jgi:hypothetical protein
VGLHYLAPRNQLRASFHNCCRSAMHAPAIVSDKMFSLRSLSLNSLSAATQYLCHYNKHRTSNNLWEMQILCFVNWFDGFATHWENYQQRESRYRSRAVPIYYISERQNVGAAKRKTLPEFLEPQFISLQFVKENSAFGEAASIRAAVWTQLRDRRKDKAKHRYRQRVGNTLPSLLGHVRLH